MKITLTIEDTPGNKVKVTAEPTFETLMKMIVSGEKETSAMGYALMCVNKIREESRRNGPTRILVPRIGRKW